jgi:hypothetical protein
MLEDQMAAVQKTVALGKKVTNLSTSSVISTWVGILAFIAIVLGGLAYTSFSSPEGNAHPDIVEHAIIPPFRG